MEDTQKYTDSLKRTFEIAQAIAKEYGHATFSPAHMLKALLHKDIELIPILEGMGKDFYFMEDWAEVRLDEYKKAAKPTDTILPDEKVMAVMEEADNIRLKMSKIMIDPISVLASIATAGVGFSYEQLKTFPLNPSELIQESMSDTATGTKLAPKEASKSSSSASKNNALEKYCVDKTQLAKDGKIDPIIGRDKEIRMVAEVLGRRTKPNVIVIGEPGVGKTALVDGFALNIAQGKVPQNLANSILFELDYGALIAGASYKGEVEDRLKNIIKEVKQYEKAILFIDEIHTLVDPQGGSAGAANLLKPELARGAITVIGATTNDEYRKYLEKDEAFSRRFEVIRVAEPDEVTATRMLKTLVPFYETHHGIKMNDDALPEAVRLAKRYIKDRRLPDAAIDLIDRTMAVVKLMGETSKDELKELQVKLDNVNSEITSLNEAESLKELKWFYNEMTNKLSHVLFSQLEDTTKVDHFEKPEDFHQYLKSTLDKLTALAGTKKEAVDKADIGAVVSHKTGIPIGKVQTSEQERLLNMEIALQGRVIGQDHALKAIADAVLENRSGLTKAGQPIGSFFFLGSTGTGKTELAKSIADFLFGDEKSMIRFDMSEFKEEHSAALLIGAPPGYVGYEEGGVLVNKIRQQPYAVVLFDEIEKAHPSVFDIFLQILDEGKIHDKLGKEGDFSNAIIIFTSNIGAERIIEEFDKGVIPKSNELMEIMQKHFRPEFLARITEIIPFAPVNENTIQKIFEIHSNSLLKTLEKMGISLTITPEAKKHLSMLGYSPRYGVRPLSGVIRNQMRRPLSRMIIGNKVKKGDKIELSLNNEELSWKIN